MHLTKGLFTAEEAFARLGQTRETGCLVIVSARDTMRIFTKEGMVVDAYSDGKDSAAALASAFTNADASYVWIPDAEPPKESLKIGITAHVLRNAVAWDLAKTSKVSLESVKTEQKESGTRTKHHLGYYLAPAAVPGKKFLIDRGTMIIGRDKSCDIFLNDKQISRRHCILQLIVRGLTFRDLESTNGVFINGILAEEGLVQAGDILSLGTYSLVVHREE